MNSSSEKVQAREWQVLRDRIVVTLNRFGRPYEARQGDYFLLDENWGWHKHQLEFQNLEMFRPACIKALQALLVDMPNWEITVRVDVLGKEDEWPGMGVSIANDEIIDELRREYLPSEFRDLRYEGSRRIYDGD